MTNVEQLNIDISKAFDALLTSLTEEQLDSNSIDRQFNDLSDEITDVEGISYPHFVEHRHRFHMIRVAYYEKMKDEKKREREERLLLKYAALREQYPITETLVQTDQKSNEETHPDSEPSWDEICQLVISLPQLQDSDHITSTLTRIQRLLTSVFNDPVRTLDKYFILQKNCKEIQNLFETLKIGEFDIILDEDNDEKPTYLDLLTEMIDFVSNRLEDRQVYFANILLSDLPQLNEMLFHNVPQTEQCITRRYREWARIFHSDKHHANPVFDELMKHINCIRDRHLSKIYSISTKSVIIQNEIDEGHKHAELSKAFKDRLKRGGDEELSINQLEKLCSFEALLAFEHYRAALKSLGKMSYEGTDIIQRAQILEWMALMMRQSGNHNIEAQLYLVAAIYVITLSNMTEELYKKLRQLQLALDKYQAIAESPIQEGNNATPANTHRELVLCTNSKLSQREIHDETQVFIRETVLRKCVVRSAQPNELSVECRTVVDASFNTSADQYVLVRSTAETAAPSMGLNLLVNSGLWILNKFVFSRKESTPFGEAVSAEYTIRRHLNTMMEEAVGYYNNEQYAKFIHRLSEPYYEDRQLMDTTRGSETISIEIRVDQIIRPLLKHGFRADKIAHLLILIGEVLLRGIDFADPILKNPEHSALLEQSKILFQGVYDSPRLSEAAVKLDERIEKYHQLKISKLAAKILDPISKKDIEDSRETPFSKRLIGYCKLARLNHAIACLLAGGKDNFERCKQSLKALKLSENTTHDRFFVISDERIQALEDLLSAFGMDDDNPNFTNSTVISIISSSILIDIDNIEYLKTHLGYLACKVVEKVNSEVDQLAILTRLVRSEHKFDCEAFIQYVSTKYSSTNELILELLRQERLSNLSEWAIKFRTNKNVFQHRAYLPLLSAFGNIKIQPCDVASDAEHEMIFVPTHTVIDYTPGKTDPRDLFVVVRSGQDHISCVFTIEFVEISHLHWALKDLPQNHPERVIVLLRIAAHYENEAGQNDKRNHLAALINWQDAQKYYTDVLSMKEVATKQQLDLAELGYCKCLLKQHRYSRINERLSARNHSLSAGLWLIYAQAQRNILDYDAAKFGVRQAIRLDPFNADVRREEKAIQMESERIPGNESFNLHSFSSSFSGEQSYYNILSIDGGGIRGVMPAIWLMELERKIRQPLSSIFHVVAGTSTGAIIGAGLTTPSLDNPSKPRYQASDLVELYCTKSDKVFSKNSSFIGKIRTSVLKEPKYLAEGRHMLFCEYFGGSKISDAASELVVPAVKGDGNVTDIFTRHAGRRDLTKNALLTEILMCTTAAPTYFPTYRLGNNVYVDGGVQANNPAMTAYDHFLTIYPDCDRNRIRLLSLGTGDYVPDPLNPDSSRNLLFWAKNYQSVFKVIMDGPQNNMDLHLNNVLRDNYYRWQIWLENPIELDDIQDASIQRLIDLAHGHLEEMEVYDNRHRLGRLIEDLQSAST